MYMARRASHEYSFNSFISNSQKTLAKLVQVSIISNIYHIHSLSVNLLSRSPYY